MEGKDTIKLEKDKEGQHHYIPMSWVTKVDDKVLTQLTHTRPIAFYNAPDSQVPPDLSKIVLVPLAVVVDLALTPVYVGGLVLFALSDL